MEDNREDAPSLGMALPYFSLGAQVFMALVMSLATLFPYRNGFFNTILSKWFFYPFFSVFAISLFMVYLVHWASVRLDKSYRWEEKFTERLLYQLLFGWVVPVLFSVLYTWAYLRFLGIDMMDTLYSRNKFPFELALALILDVAYMCYYLHWYFRIGRKPAPKANADERYPEHLLFPYNGGEIKIPVLDIAYLCSHGKHTAIQFHEQEPVILGLVTLEDVLAKLDPDQFCKVNRSYIITRKAYAGYTMRKNRGMLLLLKPEVKEDIKISRVNTDRVLSWIKNETR
ncbi:LytTr DNA-binding domain-containing protein [Mucilaginibacter pineti]|uniref:LytTr DNA-binding domain-containing protein n=1 Tax=Mucilaginibacter pineti TaxID=1391627 RepID=A0A1G7H332_9SPHI|nr:LytTR family DNA-binding domain-containing protein [Mucilaginibacter pineti]SDE94816.1 LytTr DNA-binding domain-containing protein [Mucilaginibacter pineti]